MFESSACSLRSPITKSILFLLLFCLVSSANVSCNGKPGFVQITYYNNVQYTPSYQITFVLSLETNQTITQNITASIAAKQKCIPDGVNLVFNFTQAECKPFLGKIQCATKLQLNCTQVYAQTENTINFVANGKITYAGKTATCADSGVVIKWSGDRPEDEGNNIGLIVGLAIAGVAVVGAVVIGIWWWRKKKNARQPLAEEAV